MTEQRLMELLGPLKQETLHNREDTISGSRRRPKRLVTAASFAGLDRLLTSVQIQIIGFDVAFPTNNPPPTSGCPIQLFPPELLFGCPASAKCDIWQLAANMCYIYVGSYMFQVGFEIFTHLIAFIVEYHGPLPIDWKGRFDWGQYGGYPPGTSGEALDEPEWWFDGTESTKSFDDRVTGAAPFLSGPQKDELVRLLCDMVALEPGRRISAAEAERRLKSPVFSPIWEEGDR
jgi:serine/threonine protein kinase